jgi:hypothetical protein
MLYAGFVCQQQDVMSSYMSLYVPIFISATVLESVCQLTYQVQYLLICQMLYPICYMIICRLSYAKAHMPVLYVECHVLAVASLQSDQLYAYFSTSFHMLYAKIAYMPVAVCLQLYAGT